MGGMCFFLLVVGVVGLMGGWVVFFDLVGGCVVWSLRRDAFGEKDGKAGV